MSSLLQAAELLGIEIVDDSGPEVRCLCPVHGDETPSLNINKEREVWVCFGCYGRKGRPSGGGPVELVMAVNDCDYLEAVSWLNRHVKWDPLLDKVRKLTAEVDPIPDSRPKYVAGLLRAYRPGLPPRNVFLLALDTDETVR